MAEFAIGSKKAKENREKLREIRESAAEILRQTGPDSALNVIKEEAEMIQSIVVDLLVEN